MSGGPLPSILALGGVAYNLMIYLKILPDPVSQTLFS